jgi:acetoin utilization protein AcuB
MLVGKRMSKNPVTVSEDASIDDALHLMRERKVRRLPVVDSSGKLVGIVSDKDLLHAAPSPATSLSVYELHYLLSKLVIKRLMSTPVITVDPDMPLEEAARIMVDNRIGGLPVVQNGALVGIITETDIFKVLLEFLGARVPGLRLTLAVREGKGVLAGLTGVVSELGGNIVSLVTFHGATLDDRQVTLKITEVDAESLKRGLAQAGLEVVDLREV